MKWLLNFIWYLICVSSPKIYCTWHCCDPHLPFSCFPFTLFHPLVAIMHFLPPFKCNRSLPVGLDLRATRLHFYSPDPPTYPTHTSILHELSFFAPWSNYTCTFLCKCISSSLSSSLVSQMCQPNPAVKRIILWYRPERQRHLLHKQYKQKSII